MKVIILLLALVLLIGCASDDGGLDKMKIYSSAFENGGKIPGKFTCDGENINPPLSFDGVPEGAKSLVLIMEDPDVPKTVREDGMWNHWVVFNIPASVAGVGENEQPSGVAGVTTRGVLTYSGPCPPDREHRYFFKLFALDAELDLNEGAAKEEVLKAMQGRVLDSAELVGLYERQ